MVLIGGGGKGIFGDQYSSGLFANVEDDRRSNQQELEKAELSIYKHSQLN